MQYTLEKLQERYELELDRIIKEINAPAASGAHRAVKEKPKTVLLQLPDGLKPWATTLTDYLEKNTDAQISIWLGDCFGACDLPNSNADLVIQFGHSPWGN